jgi:hypothetical protein
LGMESCSACPFVTSSIAPIENPEVRQPALILQSNAQVATMDHHHERQQ